ncbi:hypothetical protein Y023_5927 [Burkholderia pseudomallei A79D]|nr:hypothetical protein Y023_5927 [Burkholderia pseudomallei A79D]KGX94651.1 hypothetical protein X997_5775 [Burkholderia pseudomallei A79C]
MNLSTPSTGVLTLRRNKNARVPILLSIFEGR